MRNVAIVQTRRQQRSKSRQQKLRSVRPFAKTHSRHETSCLICDIRCFRFSVTSVGKDLQVKPKIQESCHDATTLYSSRLALSFFAFAHHSFWSAANSNEFHTSCCPAPTTRSTTISYAGSKRSYRAHQGRRYEPVASHADSELPERRHRSTVDCIARNEALK